MRGWQLGVAALLSLVVATGCGKAKKQLTYEQLGAAQQEALEAYGKKQDPERKARLLDQLGAPHEIKGDMASWYGSFSGEGKTPSCHVLEVTGWDGSKTLAFSMPDADLAKCGK